MCCKASAEFSPHHFTLPPPALSLCAVCVPALCSESSQRKGLYFALGCYAFVWSALISGGHIGCPGGTGNGHCANCVGSLREPYAVC